MPAGKTVKKVYEAFRDEIVSDLKAAMPVDVVFLGMHGAMVAEGYDDCESDLLAHVRRSSGPKCRSGSSSIYIATSAPAPSARRAPCWCCSRNIRTST